MSLTTAVIRWFLIHWSLTALVWKTINYKNWWRTFCATRIFLRHNDNIVILVKCIIMRIKERSFKKSVSSTDSAVECIFIDNLIRRFYVYWWYIRVVCFYSVTVYIFVYRYPLLICLSIKFMYNNHFHQVLFPSTKFHGCFWTPKCCSIKNSLIYEPKTYYAVCSQHNPYYWQLVSSNK